MPGRNKFFIVFLQTRWLWLVDLWKFKHFLFFHLPSSLVKRFHSIKALGSILHHIASIIIWVQSHETIPLINSVFIAASRIFTISSLLNKSWLKEGPSTTSFLRAVVICCRRCLLAEKENAISLRWFNRLIWIREDQIIYVGEQLSCPFGVKWCLRISDRSSNLRNFQ